MAMYGGKKVAVYPEASGPPLRLGRAAGGVDVDVDLIGDAEDESAGILETPLNIRDDEVKGGGRAAVDGPDLGGESQLVGGAVKFEQSVELQL